MIPKLGGEKKIVLSNFALYANMPLDELCKKFAAWSGKKRIARTGHDGQRKAVKAAAEANRIKATEGRAKDVRRLFDAAMSLAPDWPELDLFDAESGNDPCEAELFVYNDSMAPRRESENLRRAKNRHAQEQIRAFEAAAAATKDKPWTTPKITEIWCTEGAQ
jgi:hypothetical protein